MDFSVVNTEKHLIMPLEEHALMSVRALELVEKYRASKDKKLSPREKEHFDLFIESVKSLTTAKIVPSYSLPFAYIDLGEKKKSYTAYPMVVLPSMGRALIRSVPQNNARLNKLSQLDRWPFKAGSDALKTLPLVLEAMHSSNIKIFINIKALEKLKVIEKGFAAGTYKIEENTLEDQFMDVKSYAIYVKNGKSEGFVNSQARLGALSGAAFYESLGGAKSRAKSYQGATIVEVETKLKRISEESPENPVSSLTEAISATQKKEIEDVLKSASQEQLLNRLSQLGGAQDIIEGLEKRSAPQKRKM